MSNYVDLIGQIFGKLTILSSIKVPEKTGAYYKCKCECGNIANIRKDALLTGRSKSCGCRINQYHILKFKKENPNASKQEILRERIRAHTIQNGECLEWTGLISINGYGFIEYEGKGMNASRAAWIAEFGDIHKSKLVLHHCDNRKCCRIDHMFLGTHKDNTRDMVLKKRDNWETCRKFPVGTREKVGELREQGKMYREIMVELNLTMDQVKSLLQRYRFDKKRFDKNQ
jgi:HNH endonuclease